MSVLFNFRVLVLAAQGSHHLIKNEPMLACKLFHRKMES
jgi:hypothetical protein